MLSCCDRILKPRIFWSHDRPGLVTPVWRVRCQSCGTWYCQRGHRTGRTDLWVGDAYACQQGECQRFYDSWFKLRARFTRESSRPVIDSINRSRLRHYVWQNHSPEAHAVRTFLRRYGYG